MADVAERLDPADVHANTPVGQARRRIRSSPGPLKRAWRLLRHDVVALAALVALLCAVAIAFAAPALPLPDPLSTDAEHLYAAPGTPGHLLGTDELGRDILSRLIWGARTSLLMPLLPLAGAVSAGVLIGLISGYAGGWTDTLLMRAMDVLLAFPSVLLAIGIAAALGPGLLSALIAIGVVEMPTFARLVRSVVLGTRHLEYVEAARSMGATSAGIVSRHIVPSCFAPVLVFATLGFSRVIILAASLSFLGLGVQLPAPDWGSMLDAGRKLVLLAPHVATIPGLAILAISLTVNVLGDWLRDSFDPRFVVGRV